MKLTDDMGLAAAERLGVRLTSPDRVVYPDTGVTKAQLAAYYEAVAERMLTYLSRRLLSLVRAPEGAEGHQFFQKHAGKGFPASFINMTITENDGDVKDYLYLEAPSGLLAGVQMSVLEFHVWGSRIEELEKPERIIFDLDPDEGLGFEHVRDAATDIRDALAEWGLKSFPMLTGGKGVHVIAPLRPSAEWPLVKDFCQAFAKTLEREQPQRFTANIRKAKREGRVFVDYFRNERGSTAIAPFSTRARKGAPVATPVGWDELARLPGGNAFSLVEAAARAAAPDPWTGYFELKQVVTTTMFDRIAEPLKKKPARTRKAT
jgi:bifunctional non-homologous end joining protein LigD